MTLPDFRDEDASVTRQIHQWEQANPWPVTDIKIAAKQVGRTAVEQMFMNNRVVNTDQPSTGENK